MCVVGCVLFCFVGLCVFVFNVLCVWCCLFGVCVRGCVFMFGLCGLRLLCVCASCLCVLACLCDVVK